MLTKELSLAYYSQYQQRFDMVAPNIHPCAYFNEMDLMGIRPSGYIDEIEIKLTVADFKADFKKTVIVRELADRKVAEDRYGKTMLKHDSLQAGYNHCNRFSFLVPDTIVDKIEIPPYAGLYVATLRRNDYISIHEHKQAPMLHKRKISEELKFKIGRKMAYRYWAKMNA